MYLWQREPAPGPEGGPLSGGADLRLPQRAAQRQQGVLADKPADWKNAGLRAVRLLFTTENGVECAQVLEAYRGRGNYVPNSYTRGLYYRDVE